MPLALLLSPDDQAVSAITSVLAEMSVTCERPMDGATAARQLCAQNFDLVLLDCENLPAAQLIFDVCRRGKRGKNPVPIAIVDGHTGLPTAFRLGADLILTKPVAMDQARSTIRGAVSRVKKEQSASAMQSAQPEIAAAGNTNNEAADVAEVVAGRDDANLPAPEPSEASLTVAAATSTESVSAPETPAHFTAAPSANASATATPQIEAPAATETTPPRSEPEPAHTSFPPSDDPVLAELEAMEAQQRSKAESAAEAQVSPQSIASPKIPQQTGKRGQSRTLVLAVAALGLVCAGLYAAWMTRPEFRSFTQPQIARALTLAGKPSPVQARVAAPVAVKPAAPPTPAPVDPMTSAAAAQSSQSAATPTDAATSAATVLPATSAHATPAPPPMQTKVATSSQSVAPASAAAITPAKTNETVKPVAVQNNVAPHNAEARKPSIADAAPAIDNPEVVLSSKGAEKRLIHSVKPTHPASLQVAGEDSMVVLKAVVDNDGNVVGTQLVKGNAALAESAVAAVKQWRYQPFVRDGKTLPFQTIVMLDFSRP